MQFKRKWPIASDRNTLERRWKALLSAEDRAIALKESRDLKVDKDYPNLDVSSARRPTIASLRSDTPMPEPRWIGYRSFDRMSALVDNRLGDYLRPGLQKAHSDRQIYLASLLTKVLGHGPAAVATADLPDLDFFCQRGGRDIIPLWRDPEAVHPNVSVGVLDQLATAYGNRPVPEDVFAYAFALLAAPAYVETFWEALETPGPRLPVTADAALFAEVATLGRELLWLHTYGERFVPAEVRPGVPGLPRGASKIRKNTPQAPDLYPDAWIYDSKTHELRIGEEGATGIITDVPPDVMAFTISGFQPVKSWLDYRMASGAGRTSSPLDDIRPQTWSFDDQLLELLWVLEAVLGRQPVADALLGRVLSGPTIPAEEFPEPTARERKGPDGLMADYGTAPLFDDV